MVKTGVRVVGEYRGCAIEHRRTSGRCCRLAHVYLYYGYKGAVRWEHRRTSGSCFRLAYVYLYFRITTCRAVTRDCAGVLLSCDMCINAEEKSQGRDLTDVTVLGHVRIGSVVRKISYMSRGVERISRKHVSMLTCSFCHVRAAWAEARVEWASECRPRWLLTCLYQL